MQFTAERNGCKEHLVRSLAAKIESHCGLGTNLLLHTLLGSRLKKAANQSHGFRRTFFHQPMS